VTETITTTEAAGAPGAATLDAGSDGTVAIAVAAGAGAASRGALASRINARFDYRWIALTVVLGGTIMTILDATVVNVAIKALQDAFNAQSYSDIAWVVTGYSLAQGAVIPITGWATDRFGTKRLYLLSMFLFTAASAACGAAWSLPVLIVFRILQGLGGGMLMPIGMTIILRAFGPAQMGRVMGYFGVPMLIAPALGPVLGGWFAQDFTWRLIFYINIPVGLVSFVAAWLLLVETPTARSFRLDAIGLLTATPAVVALMYAMDRASNDGWGNATVVVLLIASAVLFTAFIWRQVTAEQPLLHLSLFRDSTFSWSIVLGFVVVTAMFGTVFLLPVFLQNVHGYGALQTGLLLVPQAATAAVLMPIGGRLTDRIGPRPVVLTGLAILAVSGVLLAHVDATTSVAVICAAMALRGVAMAFAMMPGMTAGLARIPRELTSRASSITNTAQRVGMSIGIALLVTFLSAQTAPAVAQASCNPTPVVIAEAQRSLPGHPASAVALCDQLRAAATSQQAAGAQGGTTTTNQTGQPELDTFLTGFKDDATSIGFDRTFFFLAVVAALGLIPAWFLRKPDPADAAPGPRQAAIET
jgi:EmrB/QacA subfamily drug resistance transporter